MTGQHEPLWKPEVKSGAERISTTQWNLLSLYHYISRFKRYYP